MISLILLALAVTLLNIPSGTCVGTAFIENQCDVDVYVWSIANVPNDTVAYLEPNIGNYNETYRANPDPRGGISLKIATAPDDLFITQFEYTYHPDNPRVYYDISNINGYPFETWGLYLSPSSSSSGDCSNITCDPGVAICPNAFNQPNDNFAVKNCDVSVDLTLTLCPTQTVTTIPENPPTTVPTTNSEAITTTAIATDSESSSITATFTNSGSAPTTAIATDSESSPTTVTTTSSESSLTTATTTSSERSSETITVTSLRTSLFTIIKTIDSETTFEPTTLFFPFGGGIPTTLTTVIGPVTTTVTGTDTLTSVLTKTIELTTVTITTNSVTVGVQLTLTTNSAGQLTASIDG